MIPSRLDKYLSDATTLSRREIREAWWNESVVIRGEGAADAQARGLAALVFADDEVLLDGTPVRKTPPQTYAILHKPEGYNSSARDSSGQKCLDVWLAQLPDGAFPVGRLDKETSGLIVLTDDGDLSHMMTRPDSTLQHTFTLDVARTLTPHDARLRALASRVDLQGGGSAAARSAELVRSSTNYSRIRVVLEESRSKLTRQMCHVLGMPLLAVERSRIGTLSLHGLPSGEMRSMTGPEADRLWQLCGGRERARAAKVRALARLAERMREGGSPHERLEAWLEVNGVPTQEN